MDSQDVFHQSKDGRTGFRQGTNRQVELSLRRELDDLTKKSLKAVTVSKVKKQMEPLTNSQKNILLVYCLNYCLSFAINHLFQKHSSYNITIEN